MVLDGMSNQNEQCDVYYASVSILCSEWEFKVFIDYMPNRIIRRIHRLLPINRKLNKQGWRE